MGREVHIKLIRRSEYAYPSFSMEKVLSVLKNRTNSLVGLEKDLVGLINEECLSSKEFKLLDNSSRQIKDSEKGTIFYERVLSVSYRKKTRLDRIREYFL